MYQYTREPLSDDEVNPSASQPVGRGLLRVAPERRFFILPSKTELVAAEWVNQLTNVWETFKEKFVVSALDLP